MALLLTPIVPARAPDELRRKMAPRRSIAEPGRAPVHDTERQARGAIRCASCGAVVTDDEHRISVDGAHRHTRTNPHGLRFTFACFRRAPGCSALGSPTLEWTWFPGYAWQVGVCAACSTHLGWAFGAAGGDSFVGLITDRIASEQ